MTNMSSSMVKKTYGTDCSVSEVIIRCLLKELVKLVIAELNLTNDKQFAPSKNQVMESCNSVMNRQMKSDWRATRRFSFGPQCRTAFRLIVLEESHL